jgi:hypothetical protein
MTEFLQSIKADLLSRRMLPLLAVVALALVASIGFYLKGGSSSSPTRFANVPVAPTGSAVPALPVTVATANPNQALSETPGGSHYQSQGPTRDPFIALPSPPAAKTASASSGKSKTSSKTSSSGGTSSGKSGSSGSSGGEKAPTPTPKTPTKPSKPQFPYVVSVLFGVASTTPGQPATLTPYSKLKPLQPLPSKQLVRVSFERVTTDGKGAVFKLVVPPILRGSGICLPSASECQTVDVEVGHAEELEYLEASGQPVVYELKVVSITKNDGANAARVKRQTIAAAALADRQPRAVQAIGSAGWAQASSG